ncbi:MAG: elongation factor Ts [Deltaproteobacteria bacterium]|nr:elongation factor Ts [Deltaproteobacteria bacterium]
MVTPGLIRELRERTGAGLMDCKKALGESAGDIDKAIDFLRREGILKAAKKATRITKEGLVMEAHSPDGAVAALVEVNCETDFVARTDDFKNFCFVLAEQAFKGQPATLEALKEEKLGSGEPGSKKIADLLTELVARLGENISIRRYQLFRANGGKEKVGVYVHPGNKIGVMVRMAGEPSKMAGILKDISMHVAAMHPLYLSGEQVPAAVAEQERGRLKESPELVSKPEAIAEKIVAGKYARFLSEICLLDQVFIRDMTGKGTVRETLKKVDPSLKILEFVRYQVGESA